MFTTITGFVLLLIALIIRYLYSRQKGISAGLFYAALKNENNGHFEEALTNYETALIEVEKTKYNKNLRLKIIEKIKVLHTVVRYHNSLFNLNKNAY